MKLIISVLIISVTSLLCIGCKQNNTQISYKNNLVASGHPLASLAGKNIYNQGGNAFDAAVASAFALAVVEPSMSGIGGRLQAIYQKAEGKIGGVDASTQVPENYLPSEEKNTYGYPTIGIPGVVAGLIKLHEEHGILDREKVLQPAIDLAIQGYQILPGEATRQKAVFKQLQQFEGSSSHFLNAQQQSFNSGDTIVQKALGEVLIQISEKGTPGFYQGEVAHKIVADMQENGGILTLNDLKNYQARDAQVLQGRYKDHTIHSLFLPSYGAITIQILQILDHFSTPVNENEWAQQLGRATQLAYTYRSKQEDKDSLALILSYPQAKRWAESIVKTQAPKEIISDNTPISWTSVEGHTTHLTTADQWGNVVSLTQTIGPNMGSKVATKDLGFLYAVTLGGYLGDYKPGDRANSHISPTLFTKEGKMILALGAAGGSRIPPAITQVTSRYLGQNHALEKSLMLPRVYPYNDSLWVENHSGLEELNATLTTPDFPLKKIDKIARFGRVHAIAKHKTENRWIGAADPDWEGNVDFFNIDEK